MERLDAIVQPLGKGETGINRHVGPHIVQVDNVVFRSYAIHPSEALYETDRVPVQIVVQHPGAVLEVLTLGNDVRSQQHVYLGAGDSFIG